MKTTARVTLALALVLSVILMPMTASAQMFTPTEMVVAGGWGHTIGVSQEGTITAIGSNSSYQLEVDTWTDIVEVAAGSYHSVGLKSDGTVVATGDDPEVIEVDTWTGITQIAAGTYNTIGLKSDGTVVSVGFDGWQSAVSTWTDIVQVAGGFKHVLGLKSDGTVVAVGQSEDGEMDVGAWTDIVQVASNYEHTVGVKSDGTAVATGWNEDGQCDVGAWTDIVQVAAGVKATVGLKSDGTLVGVGDNSLNELDFGTWTDIVQVTMGDYHTVGVKIDGTVVATGRNDHQESEVGDFDLMRVSTDYAPVSGTSRYDTAIKTSQAAFADGTADCVVIATGANWPDALGGAALAAAKNGPILLTSPSALTAGITGEIDRLAATEVYILGGTAAVSQDVEDALVAKMGRSSVVRIWGASRYETAEAIAAATVTELEAGAGYDGIAFVATAANFPDALAASPLAAAKGWPIFLCNPAGDPPTAAMTALGVTDALILGGTAAIPDAQQATLEAAFPGNVERLSGANRYATGVAVATYGVETADLNWNGLAMSTGTNFPDALAGGVLAGRNGSVMLLTAPDALPTSVSAKLTAERARIAKVYYLGGTSAILQSVRDQVTGILY
ncbi:MAG: cell wall-binding repeat-containing protein [Actinomycetota bacterium]|nr:cell wall-binding repeat-containing protein [Actinomycetota bacterium]